MGNIIFIFAILAVLAVLGVFAAILKNLQPGSSKEVTYDAREALFSPAERSFLGVLEQAVEGKFRVMGKVRLGDLIQPARGLSKGQRTGAWNRIHQKHLDFVLCQPDTLAVAGVVELDDVSHRRKDRAERDSFIDRALSSAGIPIVHFEARQGYAVQEVWARLDEALSRNLEEITPLIPSEEILAEQRAGKDVHELGNGPAEKMPAKEMLAARDEPESRSGLGEAGENVPTCSACNSPMVKRLAKRGPHAGNWFWACSAFPKCRKVQSVG